MNKVLNFLLSQKIKNDSPPSEELRVYERFLLEQDDAFQLKIGTKSIPLINLSYGGFAITSHFANIEEKEEGELSIYNQKMQCEFYKIFDENNLTGYAFRHKKPELLLFLRNHLEYMRIGQTCKKIDSKIMKEPYNNDEWLCLRGDGPCDIYIHETTKLTEAFILFPNDGEYAQVKINSNGIAITGKSSSKRTGQSAAIMIEGKDPDSIVLIRAALIFRGLNNHQIKNNQVQSVLNLVNNRLLPLIAASKPSA